MFSALSSLASSLTQGGGLGSMLGGGEESTAAAGPVAAGPVAPEPISATSAISGPVSFSSGGMNVTKMGSAPSTPLLIFAGVAGLVLLVVLIGKKP